jgi:UDPglucose 6-dehydrogenase
MKIGVIGLGFVGNAMMKSFIKNGLIINKDLFIYDKYKNGGIGEFHSTLNTNILFLALPTKYSKTTSSYDKSALINTLIKLDNVSYKGLVVIKSTVEPTTTIEFSKKYNLAIIHNPEFLTARTAEFDYHNQKLIVIGSTKNSINCVNTLEDFYRKYYPTAEIISCNSTESELMKITENSFCSTKIQFFNEIYLLSKCIGVDYNKVIDILVKNGKINRNHTNVPGPDGQLSYGGYCFPKDTNALLKFMETNNTPCAVLESTIKERNMMRNDSVNIEP